MQYVRTVIAKTTTPSHISSVPGQYGDRSAGTMKADEWRTSFTIHVPIALVILWGEGSEHSSEMVASRARNLLEHTMMLVAATILASKRTMTVDRINACDAFLKTYVQDLKKLFPQAEYRPNHHVCLHVPQFLKLFGPIHSWWAFPFERLNGQLQRMPKNHISGMSLS